MGPCLEALVQRSICLLDALTVMAATDRPPGARALALSTGTALLRRTRQPCINSAHIYRPLQVCGKSFKLSVQEPKWTNS